MAGYVIIWSEEARAERDAIRSFLRPGVETAVGQLEHQAEVETLQRKRLRPGEGLPANFPDPTWRLRVGPYRILYCVEGRIVRVLRVILKGRKTLGECL